MMLAVNSCSARGRGSSFVCKNVLRSLSRLQAVDLRVVATPDNWDPAQIFSHGLPAIIAVKAGASSKLLAENVRLRQGIKRHAAKTLFSLTDTSLLSAAVPHLLLIQQAHLAYPLSYLRPLIPPRHWARFLAMDAYFRAGLRSVSAITVQSNCMRHRIATRFGFPADRIIVIPSAVDARDVQSGSWRRNGSRNHYIFYPAHGDRYKNHVVLVDAMKVVKAHGMELVCSVTVRRDEVPDLVREAARAGVLHMFEFTGRLPRRSMYDIARDAAAIIVPSRLESFGLVFWEAMALGCPIIASDLDFAREACGSGAVYCNPVSGADFGEATIEVLENPSRAEELSRAGQKRFEDRHHKWSDVAAEYAATLAQL